MPEPMQRWANFLGYQTVWFIAVIGAGNGLWWPGVAAGAAFVIWQLAVSGQRRADLRLLGMALVCCWLVDGTLAASGLAQYAAPAPALPPGSAPLWIFALWASFSLTLNSSLAYLRAHALAACVLGAIGGPLAYAGAARGWDALEFAAPMWRGLAWLACAWALAMPLLATLAQRWSAPSAPEAA